MKKHLVNIFYKTEIGNFHFVGLVTTNAKNQFSPSKLFKKAFNFELPINSNFTLI